MYESYINKIEDVGKLRNLKPGTIRTYQNNVKDFLKFINKHPDELTCEDARDFLLFLKNKGNKSSTLNNKNGALVFFYKRVLGKLWDDNLVPRAINDYAIPRVLTRSEIEMLLFAPTIPFFLRLAPQQPVHVCHCSERLYPQLPLTRYRRKATIYQDAQFSFLSPFRM